MPEMNKTCTQQTKLKNLRSILKTLQANGHDDHVCMLLLLIVDSHIQRIVLATEETTVTQQVSHRPIKCQSRLWSQRGTKVNGSHHGDNPLLRPKGSKSRQKVMRLYKQWHRPISKRFIKPPYSISRATSIDSECCRLPTTNVLSKKPEKLRSNQF